ncbi:protein of unknown function [Bradyrhizobium vignae]|uniref:Uncharacterized protein n=1 Tax=Bradyrhizobium vignae TaxID=1549949 RepID=A0A2U3PS87_9BRAD|nr:protein of unknown function [Bradyrhizobium vignae]
MISDLRERPVLFASPRVREEAGMRAQRGFRVRGILRASLSLRPRGESPSPAAERCCASLGLRRPLLARGERRSWSKR